MIKILLRNSYVQGNSVLLFWCWWLCLPAIGYLPDHTADCASKALLGDLQKLKVLEQLSFSSVWYLDMLIPQNNLCYYND